MYQKFAKAISNLHRGQKGMTGLETAIILIAFVTVASVLAYSVLSAGIFSAERGKETVYGGLEQAQSTMDVAGTVLGLSPNGSKLEQVQFNVGLTIPNASVDTGAIVVNYWDNEMHEEGVTTTMELATGSTERGSESMLEHDEQFTVTVTIPTDATCDDYDTFTIQLLPPTGAAITIERTLPGDMLAVMDLQ
jgi:flagellin FlaB